MSMLSNWTPIKTIKLQIYSKVFMIVMHQFVRDIKCVYVSVTL